MKKQDSYNYEGWIISDNFFKRSFAIFAYSFMGQLIFLTIVSITFVALFLFIALFMRLTEMTL